MEVKKLIDKYSQKFLKIAKQYAADALKTAPKKAIQKTAETAGDLASNKITDKIRGTAS